MLDGVNLGGKVRSSTYALTWDTRTATTGLHTLNAVAIDTLGRRVWSAPVTVTVSR